LTAKSSKICKIDTVDITYRAAHCELWGHHVSDIPRGIHSRNLFLTRMQI